MNQATIVASALGADYGRLGTELAELEEAGVDGLQWDVMDGHFVPNITVGADFVGGCRPYTALPFEAHLMVEQPDRWLEPFVGAGCDTIIVHAEAARHLHRTLDAIHGLGAQAGVALNPATPLEAVRHVLEQVDLLLVMTVNPGFAGQAYIGTMEAKMAEARQLIDRWGLATLIEVDGGISARTAGGARQAGVDVFVAASALLRHPEGKRTAASELRRAVDLDPAADPMEPAR